MNYELRQNGFSLTEVLIAVGVLSVGMVFIAGVFPVGIYLTTIAAEQTTAAVVADEAFAKVKLYAEGDPADPLDDIDLSQLDVNELEFFNKALDSLVVDMNEGEFFYPSVDAGNSNRQYCWSALCRRVDLSGSLVQVTVFVSRKVSPSSQYPDPNDPTDTADSVSYPMPVRVSISGVPGSSEITIDNSNAQTFINDGCTIVDNETGKLYRVLERYPSPSDNTILLDRPWQGSDSVWVVPPAVGGSRNPCIAVYQKVIGF